MDKLVKRVSVVQGSGENRHAEVVYRKDEDKDSEDEPNFKRLERNVRRMLKAQVISAQEAYQRHLKSAEKGGNSWLTDAPSNFMKARRKALSEMRKSAPFRMWKTETDDDEDDDKED